MPIIQDHPPTSLLGRFARALTGPVPSPVTTTIGPGAIPLENYEEYLRRVAGTAVDDLNQVAGQPVKQMYAGVKNVLGRALADPVTAQAMDGPGTGGLTGMQPRPSPIDLGGPNLQQLIRHLVDIYHPTYLGPDGSPR